MYGWLQRWVECSHVNQLIFGSWRGYFCPRFSEIETNCARMSYIPSPPHVWWRHQIETFSALLAICAGNSPVPVNSPHKGQWRGAVMFSLICAQINGWVNNGEAGDLRRHCGHYDVNVMGQLEHDNCLHNMNYWCVCVFIGLGNKMYTVRHRASIQTNIHQQNYI